VYANVVIRPLERILTYSIPENLIMDVKVGSKVIVPLGKSRTASGFVVTLTDTNNSNSDSKPIISIEVSNCFNQDDLEFYKWVSEYYCEPLSIVIDTAIPNIKPPKKESFVSLVHENINNFKTKSTHQNKVIEYLLTKSELEATASEIQNSVGCKSSIFNQLVKKGIVNVYKKNSFTISPTTFKSEWAKDSVNLNEEQKICLKKIIGLSKSNSNKAALLHGVTGSGKTEVYIEAIKIFLQQSLGTIVLVPEIALTPQLVERFYARLGSNVAVLHSGLNDRERWENWEAIQRGDKNVVVGARSAIFCPLKNLGLIIVDEEHDSSFKQSEGLRYNARDLSYVKAKMSSATVVLGSATPSIETFQKAKSNQIEYLKIKNRHSLNKNNLFQVIDLNKLKSWEMPSQNISPELFNTIKECIDLGNQAFILYNRRGYSHYVQCEKCETTINCPNCSITLTYHQTHGSLMCHCCNFTMPVPTFCPNCVSTNQQPPGTVSLRGAGTEKTEDELKRLFPNARILRLDRDVANSIKDYQNVLNQMRSGNADILVGTQMIAKGHDLPNVTLAAVIDCDVGLHMPDFRAPERVFQLLSQLSGRAGRADKPGKVILQTRVPKHPSLKYTAQDDFNSFAIFETESRQALGYPPFSRLLRIVVQSVEQNNAQEIASNIGRICNKFEETLGLSIRILGPAPCVIERIRAKWRWNMLIKAKNASDLIKLVQVIKKNIKLNNSVKVIYDIDPQEML
jgi:primosomal protein N' (replication factor Y)